MTAARSTLAEDYEALVQFFYMAPVGLAQLANDGKVILMNSISAQLLMPLSRNDGISNLFTTLEGVAPELRHLVAGCGGRSGKICDALRFRIGAEGRGKSGAQTLSLTLVRVDPTRIMAVLTDITDKREAREAQRKQVSCDPLTGIANRRAFVEGAGSGTEPANVTEATGDYESLMQFLYRAPIGLIQATLAGDIQMINPMAANLLMPLSKDGTLDNLFTALQSVAPQLRELTSAIEHRSGTVCESLRLSLNAVSDSGAAPQILSLSLLKLNDNQLMGVIIDATLVVRRERVALSRQLGAAARIDKLTRMPNRLVVVEQLALAMARTPTQPGYLFALLYMNCDRLELINDSLGHAVGDEVLSLMADRLRFALRTRQRGGFTAAGAPMAARLDADEFVVILDDLDRPEDAKIAAQRLIDVLAEPYAVGSHQVYCSVSIGIVLRDSATGDPNEVLQDASLAMQDAKGAGGGRYALFDLSMNLRAKHRGTVEADLHRALEEHQLFVVYMPVVGLQGGAVDRSAGVEALVRWRHPTRGVVPPIEFIGVAENSGMIGALDEFVLRTACRQFMQWQVQCGPAAPRKIAVNLSRAELGLHGLVATVDGILRESGMPPAQLQLEVTESLAAQGPAAQARLHELKALGLKLGLDDFGTGYSSLSSLHLLPVDTLKIDQSFVGQADTDPHQRALIDATIRVAHSLGMTTVAEGIETEAQAAVVRQLGSDYGQGYLYSKPLLSDDLLRWLGIGAQPAAVA